MYIFIVADSVYKNPFRIKTNPNFRDEVWALIERIESVEDDSSYVNPSSLTNESCLYETHDPAVRTMFAAISSTGYVCFYVDPETLSPVLIETGSYEDLVESGDNLNIKRRYGADSTFFPSGWKGLPNEVYTGGNASPSTRYPYVYDGLLPEIPGVLFESVYYRPDALPADVVYNETNIPWSTSIHFPYSTDTQDFSIMFKESSSNMRFAVKGDFYHPDLSDPYRNYANYVLVELVGKDPVTNFRGQTKYLKNFFLLRAKSTWGPMSITPIRIDLDPDVFDFDAEVLRARRS